MSVSFVRNKSKEKEHFQLQKLLRQKVVTFQIFCVFFFLFTVTSFSAFKGHILGLGPPKSMFRKVIKKQLSPKNKNQNIYIPICLLETFFVGKLYFYCTSDKTVQLYNSENHEQTELNSPAALLGLLFNWFLKQIMNQPIT